MTLHRFVYICSLLCIALIGYADHTSGSQVSMMLLYAIPILLSAWYCGRLEGLIVASGAAASWLFVNYVDKLPGNNEFILSWNAFTRLGIFCLIAYTVSLQSQLRQALERERLRADTDRLTGLFNKGAFRERVEDEMKRARRYNHPMSIAFIDLDNFKLVNDTEGHARGDKLLQQVSETIVRTIRITDIAGRVGGDEFTICFPETGDEQVRNVIIKLTNSLALMTKQSGWHVTASIGVVTCKEVSDSYDTLLGKADKLMYIAKENGKNSAEFISI